MDADFAIELGREDPVLDFPWDDPAGEFAYFDVKRHPELLARISEAEQFPELREFLRTVNSARSTLETAKCDAWATTELNAEEEVYGASHKFASYVDAVFVADLEACRALLLQFPLDQSSLSQSPLPQSALRQSLIVHEQFSRRLVELLRRAPEIQSAADVCVRRCYFPGNGEVREGFYFTLYTSGYGNDEEDARRNWEVGLKLVGNAILQLSVSGWVSGLE
jgi:hypothetical protein